MYVASCLSPSTSETPREDPVDQVIKKSSRSEGTEPNRYADCSQLTSILIRVISTNCLATRAAKNGKETSGDMLEISCIRSPLRWAHLCQPSCKLPRSTQPSLVWIELIISRVKDSAQPPTPAVTFTRELGESRLWQLLALLLEAHENPSLALGSSQRAEGRAKTVAFEENSRKRHEVMESSTELAPSFSNRGTIHKQSY
jgi:hypothetical protein